MRVNIYAEEMTNRVEIIEKEIEGVVYTGVRFYLELPCTIPTENPESGFKSTMNVRGPFMHRPGDDDSGAVTFWGKKDLRSILQKAITLLDQGRSG